jgi:SNF2 family DNA or RNA helicase
MLQKESEIPIEQLREMYAHTQQSEVNDNNNDEDSNRPHDVDGDEEMKSDCDGDPRSNQECESKSQDEKITGAQNESDKIQLESIPALADNVDCSKDHSLEDDSSDAGKVALERLERSSELARQTLASRPFLLAPWLKMREYQQTGLNWLVSLQTRRLNGILADGKSDVILLYHFDRTFLFTPVSLSP